MTGSGHASGSTTLVDQDGLLRAAGLSAVLGGVLMMVDVLAHLAVDDRLRPAELAGIPHELWHVPSIVALPLALMGLFAVYLTQTLEAGRLGLWGFGLLVVGMSLGAIYSSLFHGLFLPAIEAVQSGLFEVLVSTTTPAQFARGVVVQALGLGLGAVLFGAAVIRARVLPAPTGFAVRPGVHLDGPRGAVPPRWSASPHDIPVTGPDRGQCPTARPARN